jgi:hypothetical protein
MAKWSPCHRQTVMLTNALTRNRAQLFRFRSFSCQPHHRHDASHMHCVAYVSGTKQQFTLSAMLVVPSLLPIRRDVFECFFFVFIPFERKTLPKTTAVARLPWNHERILSRAANRLCSGRTMTNGRVTLSVRFRFAVSQHFYSVQMVSFFFFFRVGARGKVSIFEREKR